MSENVPASGNDRPADRLSPELLLLREYLASANKIASRLAWSRDRVGRLISLDPVSVNRLGDEDIERLDAFLFRFNSLAAMVQDHITRALLKAEEEDIADRSRKDQRLILEKLGALKPQLDFGTIAELRNRVSHLYPDSAKQAEIMSQVYRRSADLIDVYNDVLAYVDRKFFALKLDLKPTTIAAQSQVSA